MFRLYVGNDIKRLPAFKITFHYLLHIQACIKNCGPCWVYWQYPIERLCGMLQPMVQSCKHPYKNLMNNVLLLEQFYHLRFVPTIYMQDSSPSAPPKKYHSQQVIWIEDGGEELWAPSLNYTDWGVKYSKLRTKEGYMHGSSMTIVAANTRNNACVMV